MTVSPQCCGNNQEDIKTNKKHGTETSKNVSNRYHLYEIYIYEITLKNISTKERLTKQIIQDTNEIPEMRL